MMFGDFFTPEAGQRRRQWLDGKMGSIAGGLDYFLGPTGIPERMGALAQVAEMSDAGDYLEAGDASQALWNEPSLQNAARYATAGTAMMLPFIGAKGTTELSNNAIDWLADEDGAIRAWHGSPHDFDRFDMSKIGTGEGAQAYGHGLYFAENEAVGRGYRDQLSDADWFVGGAPYDHANPDHFAAAYARDFPSVEAAIANLARQNAELQGVSSARDLVQQNEQIIQRLRSGNLPAIETQSKGRLYEVEINANPEDFLDWDAPWASQPDSVKNAVWDQWKSLGGTVDGRTLPPFTAREDAGIQEILAAMNTSMSGGQGAGEMALREAGIPGIRYLDAGSRGAGDGSRNYVVFDDQLVTILKKYGLGGILGLSAAQSLPQDEQAY